MQLVSAVKMKKAQQVAIDGKPYQSSLSRIIRKISTNIDSRYSLLISPPASAAEKKLIIVISTNKGLCGSFNFNLFRFISKAEDMKNASYITVGKKGSLFVYKMGGEVLADFSTGVALSSVSAIFNLVLERYLKGEINEVVMYYNRFISTLKSEPTQELLLPLKLSFEQEVKEFQLEYSIEPDPKKIIDALLKSFIEQKIRYAIIENEAGEHSARMMAMKNATDNADDVIYNLTLLRNKLRQDKITYELLDMITAKESVETN